MCVRTPTSHASQPAEEICFGCQKLARDASTSLGVDHSAVRADGDVAIVGLVLVGARDGGGIVADVGIIRPVAAPVGVESKIPRADAGKADVVRAEGLALEIEHDDNIVAGTTLIPAMKCDDAGSLVDMKNVDIRGAEAARIVVPVAAEVDQPRVEGEDAATRRSTDACRSTAAMVPA